ncbi:MAG: phospholipase, partial [Parvibaculum sp.]|nr:phospholipase [Parvibaculum sp.]
MTATSNEKLIDAIDALLPALLQAMDAVSFIARHMHPPLLESLVDQMGPVEERLRAARLDFDA